MRFVPTAFLLLTVQLATRSGSASDWPTWRHDAGRSGATDEQLPAELHLQWARKLPQLTPAWSEDVRLQFDAHYEPIVKGKLMFIASSRNDSVTAYDTDTGEMRWRFIADAPVRFAPVAIESKLYFGADDGCLYCLEAATGKLTWKLNATPASHSWAGAICPFSSSNFLWVILSGPKQ